MGEKPVGELVEFASQPMKFYVDDNHDIFYRSEDGKLVKHPANFNTLIRDFPRTFHMML